MIILLEVGGARNSSDTYYVTAADSGKTAGTVVGSGSFKAGIRITPKQDLIVFGATKVAGSGATNCYIRDASNTVNLATGTYSSNYCAFTTNITLTANQIYYIIDDKGGASYDVFRFTSSNNVSTAYLNFSGGYYNNIPDATTHSITTLNIAVSPTTTSQTFTNTYSSGSNIKWNVKYCDLSNVCSFATSNRTFKIDSAAPSISISSPEELEEYGRLGGNLTLNFTATDTNLDDCWYSYNGTNTTVSCSSGVLSSSQFTLSGSKTLTVYANDSIGNTASQTITWDYFFFEEGQSFNEQAYETDSELFSINISTGIDILTSSGIFVYDGTSYTTTGTCIDNRCSFSKRLDLNLVESGEYEEKESYWNLILYDGSTSHNITTETRIQNVTRIHLEKCGGGYTTRALNFTTYREDNLTRISVFKISGTFETWLGSGSVTRNQSFNEASTSSLELCLSPNIKNQFTDAQIEYSFENENVTYIPRNYYLQNATLTNASNNISLYLLEAEDSTTFIIKVQDQKVSGVADALVSIQRYYPSDGKYRVVQIAKTGSSGETVGFYQTETAEYKHLISRNNVVLLETVKEPIVGKEVPFTLTFTTGEALGYPWAPWINDENIQKSLTFNKTSKIVTFTYIDTSGLTTLARLVVVELSKTNSTIRTICNTSSVQSSATLTCNMTGYDGNFVAYGYIETEAVDILPFLITTARDIFGREGLLIGVFIIMVAGFAFIWNPTAGIMCINAAVILVNLIGFISVSPVFIFAMICVSIIAGILLKT